MWADLCVAQDNKPPAHTSPVEATPQPRKEYSSIEGGFSILFPESPNVSSQLLEVAPGVQFKLHIHSLKTPTECSVIYADYPIPMGDPAVAKSVLDSGVQGAVASVNSALLEHKELTFAGHPGRYLKERMPRGEIMRVKMLLVGQRMYQVAITTPREEGASVELVKQYETLADKFLNSFKLLKKDEKPAGSKQ
jgi:hypothetical protein